MILGDYPAGIYFQVSSIVTVATLIIIYWISQYYGHDKPFPHSWISNVADHFPEYVFFRIATISGSTLMLLGWFVNHFYIQNVGVENVINIHQYKPSIMLVIGIIGSFLLMGTTATIDTGKMNDKWHNSCASSFFIFTLIAQIYNTAIFSHLYFKYNAVSRTSTYLKIIHLVLLIIQLLESTNSKLWTHYGEKFEENDLMGDKGIFLEWTLTLTVVFGFLIMSMDVKNFNFVYEKYGSVRRDERELQVEMMN
jgi:hypothetical protein